MTSVAIQPSATAAAPPTAAVDDDVLHLLFNHADGILAGEQRTVVLAGPQDATFDPPSVCAAAPSPPSDSSGSGSGCSFWSSDDLLQFDLDSFLSSAEVVGGSPGGLGHAAYDLDLPALSGAAAGGGGGPVRPGGGDRRRKQRQLSQLPYSIADLMEDDEAGQSLAWDDEDEDPLAGDEFGQPLQPEGQPGEPLLLTAEEARVARQLGAALPPRYPLTREEAKVLRTVRRKIRNKISAKNSRAKKQEYVRGLEQRVKGSVVENSQLRERCAGLEQQNRRLLGAVRRLQAFLRATGLSLSTTAGKATSTGFFILCLSFALFLTPQLSPFLTSPGAAAPGSDPALRPASGRRILQAPAVPDAGAKQVQAVPPDLEPALEPDGAGNNASFSGGEAGLDSPTAPVEPASTAAFSSPVSSAEDDAIPKEQDLADRDL